MILLKNWKKATIAGILILIVISVGFVSYRLYPKKITEYEVRHTRHTRFIKDSSLNFYKDGQKFLSYFVRTGYNNETNQLAMLLSTWHKGGTHLDSLKTILHLPKDPSGNLLGIVYLKRPDGYPFPSIDFHRNEDFDTTVINIPDLGFQGDGTVTLELMIDLFDSEVEDFNISLVMEGGLSEKGILGQKYMVRGRLKHHVTV